VRLEGLGQLKKFNDLVGKRSRDLPAYSIVPQPTTLPRAPLLLYTKTKHAGVICSRLRCHVHFNFFNWYSGGGGGGGVQLGPLDTTATNRPIVPAPVD
jgi:hypothetical protein